MAGSGLTAFVRPVTVTPLAGGMRTPNQMVKAMMCGFAAAMPASAHAGAWNADKQTIAAVGHGVRDEGAFSEADVRHEQRLNARLALVAQARAEFAAVYGPENWRGEAFTGVKWQAWRPSNGALAFQAGPFWTYEPAASCNRAGAEARALAGRAFGAVFVEGQAAWRFRGTDCNHGKLDVTVGVKPSDDWLLLGQAFLDKDLSLGVRGRQTEKIQLSAVKFDARGRGLQLGVRQGLERSGDETAILLGWWSAR